MGKRNFMVLFLNYFPVIASPIHAALKKKKNKPLSNFCYQDDSLSPTVGGLCVKAFK